MYTFVVKEDNLPKATVRTRIIQNSHLVDSLRFLVYPIYKNEDMKNYSATLEYVTPFSKNLIKEDLYLSDECYRDYLQYVLPVNTNITSEYGNVRLRLTFTSDKTDESGNIIRYVRRTSSAILRIIPYDNLFDGGLELNPDIDVSFIEQKINSIETQIENLNSQKADNIVLTENGLQLQANDKITGDGVSITELTDAIVEDSTEGLIKIIEF